MSVDARWIRALAHELGLSAGQGVPVLTVPVDQFRREMVIPALAYVGSLLDGAPAEVVFAAQLGYLDGYMDGIAWAREHVWSQARGGQRA